MPNDYLRLIDTPTGASVATGAVPESSNPYMATLEREEQSRRARFRASVSTALDSNPDEVARQRRVAQLLGRPPAVVEALPEEASRAARMRLLESETMDAPALRRQMIDEGFARVAHDDVNNLSQLERLMRAPELRAPSGPAMSIRSFFGGLGASFVQGSERARQGLRQQFADAVGVPEMAADARRRTDQANFREFLATPEIESITGRAAYGGLQSLVRQVPGLAASIATRSAAPALAWAGVTTQAEAYGKYRGRDASGAEAFLASVGEGAVEVLTEMIPLGTMLGAFGRPGRQFATQFVKSQVQEQFGEQVATVLQDAIDTAVANPNKTWADYWAERPEAAYSTFISTLVQSGALGAAHAGAARLARQERAAEAAEPMAAGLANLAAMASASKLAGRDVQSFEAFVRAAAEDGPVTDVYIDAQVLLQSGVAERVAQASPAVAEQLEEAARSGGQVRIPIEEFAARIATTDAAPALLEHLKTEPDGFSRAEAAEFMAEQGEILQREVERQMTEQQADATFRTSQEAVRQSVLAQLTAANRFTAPVNEFNATLIAARTATRAAALGVTPEQFFERQMLRVRGEGPLGPGVMAQPTTRTGPLQPSDVEVTVDAFEEETGRRVSVRVKADVALKQIEEDEAKAREIMKCLLS